MSDKYFYSAIIYMQGMFYEIMINIKKKQNFFWCVSVLFYNQNGYFIPTPADLIKKQIESNDIHVHAQGNVNYKLNKLI